MRRFMLLALIAGCTAQQAGRDVANEQALAKVDEVRASLGGLAGEVETLQARIGTVEASVQTTIAATAQLDAAIEANVEAVADIKSGRDSTQQTGWVNIASTESLLPYAAMTGLGLAGWKLHRRQRHGLQGVACAVNRINGGKLQLRQEDRKAVWGRKGKAADGS